MSAAGLVRFGLIAAGVAMVGSASMALAHIDLEFKDITFEDWVNGREAQVGIRPYRGPEAGNTQHSHYGGDPAPGAKQGDAIVGFTLFTLARNVGAEPVPWGFPVIESSDNPWITSNGGFTGQESTNHQHTRSTGVGPHPHILFSLYRKPIGGGEKELVGLSDLKHTYRSIDDAGEHHSLGPGAEDPYNHDHNQDQNFYSPYRPGGPNPDGFNAQTGALTAHEHFGSKYRPGPDTDRERDHGELNFAGGTFPDGEVMPADPGHPGHDNIDHLLQARVDALIDSNYCYFVVGTYYVLDDVDSGNFENSNNTLWREFDPGWDGTEFRPVMGSAKGHGLSTLDAHACVPEPSSLLYLAAALLALRRVSVAPHVRATR